MCIRDRTCPDCHGTGKIIREKCPDCAGTGYISSKKKISVKIPAGIDDGQSVRTVSYTHLPLTMFRMNDYVDDIKDIMAKKRFRDFPILDRHGRFKGFISRRRFLGASKKKVILVDHNERSQAVDGIEAVSYTHLAGRWSRNIE